MADDFARQVRAWTGKTQAALRDVLREAFVDVALQVIDYTPEETGAAKGNWTATRGETSVPWDRARRQAEARAAVEQLAATLDFGDTAALVSSLPYIRKLEYSDGYFMIRGAVQSWPIHVERAVQKAKAKHGLR
jgi:hypothetical protein